MLLWPPPTIPNLWRVLRLKVITRLTKMEFLVTVQCGQTYGEAHNCIYYHVLCPKTLFYLQLSSLQSVVQLKLAANCLKAVHRYDLFRMLNIYLWLNHINSTFSINVIARHTTQCYGLDMNSKEVAMVKQINISIISVNPLVCFLCNESR